MNGGIVGWCFPQRNRGGKMGKRTEGWKEVGTVDDLHMERR